MQYRISSSALRLKSLRIEHPARRQYNGQRSVCIFHLPWSTYVLPAIFLHQMKSKFFAVEKWPKLSQPVLPLASLSLPSSLPLAAINILARKREPINKKYIYSLSLRFFMKSRMLHFLGIKWERIKMARKEALAGGGDVAAAVLPVPAR